MSSADYSDGFRAGPSFPRTGVSVFPATLRSTRQTAVSLLSPHVRGERTKVRGPNRDFGNFLDFRSTRYSGTLTPPLSRDSAGEGEHSAQRENRQPRTRESRWGRVDPRFRDCRFSKRNALRYAAKRGRLLRANGCAVDLQGAFPFVPSRPLLSRREAPYRRILRGRIEGRSAFVDTLFRGDDHARSLSPYCVALSKNEGMRRAS
jgi:hypothetical protein